MKIEIIEGRNNVTPPDRHDGDKVHTGCPHNYREVVHSLSGFQKSLMKIKTDKNRSECARGETVSVRQCRDTKNV